MRIFTMFVLSTGFSVLGLARTVDPSSGYCRLLERIAVAVPSEANGTVSLELLELVALGKTESITNASELHVGLERGQIHQGPFTSPSVRVCTFHYIGEIGSPTAREFLASLKKSDLGPDTTGMIWPAAQYALANSQLNTIADSQSKIEFLERLVIDRAPASYWAANQLCDRGALESGFVTRKYFTSLWRDQYGEEQAQFCECRMRVVASNHNRVMALGGSVLRVENVVDSDRVTLWAINQLANLFSPVADAELRRFSNELRTMTKGQRAPQGLAFLAEDIDRYLQHNENKRRAQNTRAVTK